MRPSEMSVLHTVDVEKRLRLKRDDFVSKQHLLAKSDVWKHFSLVFEKRPENNERSVLSKSGRVKVFVFVIVVLVCIATRRRTAVVSVQKLGTTGD